MNFRVKDIVKSICRVVEKFDKVWKDCKIVYGCGIMVGIVGGILIIGGGVVIIVLFEIVVFLLLIGLGFGLVSVVINLGISIVEDLISLIEMKKVEKDLKEIFDFVNNVKKMENIV